MAGIDEVRDSFLLAIEKAKEIIALSINGGTAAKELAEILNTAWGPGISPSTEFMSMFEKALEADRDFEILSRRTQELVNEAQSYIERL
jgi:hypothetical protein